VESIMSWQDVNMITAVIAAVVTVIPFALTLVAARAGYRQVREFHERTGDDSLLASITAFSRFHDEVKPKEVAAKATHKEPEGAY
jgi:hypothetical protein